MELAEAGGWTLLGLEGGAGAKAREQLGLQVWFARVAEKGYIARAKGKVTNTLWGNEEMGNSHTSSMI